MSNDELRIMGMTMDMMAAVKSYIESYPGKDTSSPPEYLMKLERDLHDAHREMRKRVVR